MAALCWHSLMQTLEGVWEKLKVLMQTFACSSGPLNFWILTIHLNFLLFLHQPYVSVQGIFYFLTNKKAIGIADQRYLKIGK